MNFPRIAVIALTLAIACPVLAQDADDAYSDARRALNRRDFDEAIAAFQALRRDYPDSAYVGDSYYWEAFALERNGNLERAVDVIDQLLSDYPQASTVGDARALRIQVCSDLARRGDGECAQAVAPTVLDPARLDDETRMAAVNALLNMRADRAVPLASEVAANRAQSVAVRKQALFVLSDKAEEIEGDNRARDVLRRIALDETDDPEVRAQATFWLSEVPGEDTLEVLTEIMSMATTPELKERAVFAISQHDDPRAMTLLRQFAEDEALDVAVRKRAIFWIGDEGGGEALPFLTELYDNLSDAQLRQQVLFAVSETGAAESKPWLLDRARDSAASLDVRRKALFWAAEVGMTADELAGFYESFEEPALREHLIWLISDQGGEGALDRLLEIARNDPDPNMRAKAVFWIGDSEDPRASDFLRQLLGQ